MKPARRSRPACSALLLADVFDFRVSSLETRKAQPQAENTRIGQRATCSQRKPLEVAVSNHPLHAPYGRNGLQSVSHLSFMPVERAFPQPTAQGVQPPSRTTPTRAQTGA